MEKMNLDEINQLVVDKKFEEAKNELLKYDLDQDKNLEALKLLGLCNVNLEKYREGQTNFETVVKYDPEDASSWFYLASCYDNMDDKLHAVTAYLKVIELRESFLDAYKNLCVLYVRSEDQQKAIDLALKALEFEKDDYTFFYILGTAYMSMKNFDESVKYLEKALELKPEHPQLYNNLGTSYVTIGDLDKAYENFLKATEYDPDNSLTYFNIASILQLKGKHEEACEYFEKAYFLGPEDSYLVALALSETKCGRYDSAIAHYKTLISHHPEKDIYQYNLACCYEMKEDYNYAIGILAHLVMLNPKSINMAQKLANIYVKVGKPAQAKEIYEKILLQGNVNEDLYYEFAHVCLLINDTDKAEKILKKVIELNPKQAQAHKDLGVIFLQKRLFDYAKEEFESAYDIAPDNFSIVFEYANYLHATTNFAKADEMYTKALEIEPNDRNALTFSALNKLQIRDFDKAEEQIDFAIQHSAHNSFLLYVAGKVRFAKQDYERAKDFLVKSYELEQTAEIENLLGICYMELDNFAQANVIFEKLMNDNEGNINLMLNRAKCFEKMDDATSALFTLDKVVEIFPDCEEAHEMIRRLS
ncbi:tetratricopeptide repeat protein [bacterium]|nr:tetratricopeptide repeat protein [bacterium]